MEYNKISDEEIEVTSTNVISLKRVQIISAISKLEKAESNLDKQKERVTQEKVHYEAILVELDKK